MVSITTMMKSVGRTKIYIRNFKSGHGQTSPAAAPSPLSFFLYEIP
jgi:hypothetical protein